MRSTVAVFLLILASAPSARAEMRGVLRVGVRPVTLSPERDTPILGARVDDAVQAYNAAADAYERAHGGTAPAEMEPIDRGDLGVSTTMLTLAPGLEVGDRSMFFRIEAALGFGADHRSYGVGFYPFNVALRRKRVTPYLSAGGSLSWFDDTRLDGEVGVLMGARVAGGLRLGRRVTLELGYNAYSIGGVLDRDELDTMRAYDPTGPAPPPRPETALSGGESTGTIDVSVGLAL